MRPHKISWCSPKPNPKKNLPTYTYKIEADNQLHNCVCGALSVKDGGVINTEWDSSAPPFRQWRFRQWNVKCVFLWNVTKVQKFALPSFGKCVSARVSLALVPDLSNYAVFIAIHDAYHGFVSAINAYSQGRTQGGVGVGVNPPLEIHIFQKLYYLRKGDYLFVHTFCFLICRLNANTTEWICMQISRNIVNGPRSHN